MKALVGRRALVTGGSAGLGLGVVEALVDQGAEVTVVARRADRLIELGQRLGVSTVQGDMASPSVIESALAASSPEILILNGGAVPHMAPLHEQTWESFSRNWEVDVKASFLWVQAALNRPLRPGTRVVLSSSGAAVNGSPLSGSYAGAKRMIWLMAQYANATSAAKGLGIRFQAVIPLQIVGDTDLGRAAAEAYARQRGVSPADLLAGFGAPLLPAEYGRRIVEMLLDPRFDAVPAFTVKGGAGVQAMTA